MDLSFTCPAFEDDGIIPLRLTGRGADESPEFIIDNLSADAKTVAIIMDDIKHPIFKIFNHWVIWNIPATKIIPAAIPAGKTVPTLGGAMQGIGYGRHKYAGPKPPKGTQHAYKFTLYALDCKLDLKSSTKKKHLLSAMEGHILQQGSITGVFE